MCVTKTNQDYFLFLGLDSDFKHLQRPTQFLFTGADGILGSRQFTNHQKKFLKERRKSKMKKKKNSRKSCPCQRIVTAPKGDRSQNLSWSEGPLGLQSYMMCESGHRSQCHNEAAWASPPLHIVQDPPRILLYTHTRAGMDVNKCLLQRQTMLFCLHYHSFFNSDLYTLSLFRMCDLMCRT